MPRPRRIRRARWTWAPYAVAALALLLPLGAPSPSDAVVPEAGAAVEVEPAALASRRHKPSRRHKRHRKVRRTRHDIDGDGIRNARDRNVDGDRRRNVRDRDVDGDRRTNFRDWDIDGDGTKNAWDSDSDSSGDARLGIAGAAPRVGREFFGVISDDAFWGTDADPSRARTLGAISATGVGTLRTAFFWSIIEPRPGVYDYELYDGYMAAAAARGLRVMPLLFDPPAFRSSRPRGSGARGTYPPSDNVEFSRFAARLVLRYGPNGAFWRSHPELPQLPVRAWQVWNEPNLKHYWASGPNPAAYAAMLKSVSAGIKWADRSAEVVTAGLNESEIGMKLTPFLNRMYRAGARGSFDTLALHPYAPASDLVVAQVRRGVKVMRRHGDDARIRITELGWASGGPRTKSLVVGERAQAALVRSTLPRLVRLRERLRLNGIYYFNWRDAPPYQGGRDFWGLHAGLLRQNGSPKPVLGSFTRTVRALSLP